jgi:hypothetical protein
MRTLGSGTSSRVSGRVKYVTRSPITAHTKAAGSSDRSGIDSASLTKGGGFAVKAADLVRPHRRPLSREECESRSSLSLVPGAIAGSPTAAISAIDFSENVWHFKFYYAKKN